MVNKSGSKSIWVLGNTGGSLSKKPAGNSTNILVFGGFSTDIAGWTKFIAHHLSETLVSDDFPERTNVIVSPMDSFHHSIHGFCPSTVLY